MKSESVVFCEGYLDRAFWKGWLKHLGCTNLFETKRPVMDPWSGRVTGGEFGFLSKSGNFIRVRPCDGKSQVLPLVRNRLKGRETKAVTSVIVNWDADTFDNDEAAGVAPRTTLSEIVGSISPDFTKNAEGTYQIDGANPTSVYLVIWSAEDGQASGIPAKQTLERLCCAALREVHPDRAEEVQKWLAQCGDIEAADPKSFSWSHMAGWYPDRGCEGFYEALRQDEAVAAALRTRLEATGSWQIAKSLAE
jgi:hypothetical protein